MNRTVMIGLDGATFTILDELMREGVMPSLKRLCDEGSRTELLSTSNPLTPPAWVSMITGRSPGNHGVFDFIWAEERKNDVYFTLYNFLDIACETVWSYVSRHEGRVTSLNFPMMSPPPPVNGVIVPGLVSWKHLRRNIHPREIYDRFKELPGFSAKDMAWDFELEKKAEKGVQPEEYENWVRFHIKREKQWFEIADYVMKNEPADLTAVLFDGVDKLLHIAYKYMMPASSRPALTAGEEEIRGLCLEYFRELDGFIGRIIELAGPEARIFVTSDHGFGPTEKVFRVNTWLNENGYLTWKGVEGLGDDEKKSVEKLIERHFVYLDWDRTTAYARTTTSNGIYIRVAEDGRSGIRPEDYARFRDELVSKLLAVRDPATGEPFVERVMTREEAYPGRNNRLAPDLTLVMKDHSFASIVNEKPAIVTRPEVAGTHYPEGIFIARGPGIARGAKVKRLDMVDVAPCLIYSLGLAVPEDLEGRLPEGLFEKAHLDAFPYAVSGRTVAPESGAGAELEEAEEKEKIFDKLKMLGYIE